MEFNAKPLIEKKGISKSEKIWICIYLIIVIACCCLGVFWSNDNAKVLVFPGFISLALLLGIWPNWEVKTKGAKPTYVLTLIFVAAVISFGVVQIRSFYQEQQLKRYGVVSYANVVEVNNKKRLNKRRSVFRATIEFNVNGKAHYKSINNKKQLYGVNDTLKIVYSSRDPDIFAIRQHKKWNPNPNGEKIISNAYQNMAGNAQIKEDFLNAPPQFRGGMSGFAAYLRNNLVYPGQARINRTEGKVYLSFVVQSDGRITDVKVERGIGDGCDEAAVKVIKNSPLWLPGVQNDKPVRVKYNIPIIFTL